MSVAGILVGPGSRDPQGVEEFRHFAARAHEVLAGEILGTCFRGIADPAILDIIERCVPQGAPRRRSWRFFWCRPVIKRTTCPARDMWHGGATSLMNDWRSACWKPSYKRRRTTGNRQLFYPSARA